jgi:predicted nucleic acid-binding protein
MWVVDTSIFVGYLRFGRYRHFVLKGLAQDAILVPGVVLCELYAGAVSRYDRADVEALRRALGPRLLAAETEDWVLAGRCLSAYSQRWGKLRPRDHIVDALVATSAERTGARLASADYKQVSRWGSILRRLGRPIQVYEVAD